MNFIVPLLLVFAVVVVILLKNDKTDSMEQTFSQELNIWESLPFWLVSLTLGLVVERYIIPRVQFKKMNAHVLSIIISSVLLFIVLVLWAPSEVTNNRGVLNTNSIFIAVLIDTVVNYIIIFLVYPRLYPYLAKQFRRVK